MSFSFSFSDDDIIKDVKRVAEGGALAGTYASMASYSLAPSAFPVPGASQLPATYHSLPEFLSQLPSKIAFDILELSVTTGENGAVKHIRLPRRELWDVRVQLMAEDENVGGYESHIDDGGLGKHDVKTGIYEGGFKSWESSIDLVKVLATREHLIVSGEPALLRVIELGCGTALPSLAMFNWMMQMDQTGEPRQSPCSFILGDYNPSVLRLVTLPNFILSWALHNQQALILQDSFNVEGELQLNADIIEAFQNFLLDTHIDISFISGAWSPEFSRLMFGLPCYTEQKPNSGTILLGAETIYSPFALQSFTQMVFTILEHELHVGRNKAEVFVAAKRLYFGVGGSLNEFVDLARERGALVTELCEETEGVRRGVVHCVLQN